jgi:hypothetical protein
VLRGLGSSARFLCGSDVGVEEALWGLIAGSVEDCCFLWGVIAGAADVEDQACAWML